MLRFLIILSLSLRIDGRFYRTKKIHCMGTVEKYKLIETHLHQYFFNITLVIYNMNVVVPAFY